MSDKNNMRGALMMVVAMAAFSVEDSILKVMSDYMSTGQVMVLLGLGGGALFTLLLRIQGGRLWTRDVLHPTLMIRNLTEMLATACMITALALTPISTVSSILQAMPLIVVMGAALFLGERVGPRRWTAIGIGMIGMTMIMQPWGASFDPNLIFSVLAVLGLAARDLVTRRVPDGLPNLQIAALGFFAIVPAGIFILATTDQSLSTLSPGIWALTALSWVIGPIGYFALIVSTRVGEASFVAPYRYSRLVFGLIIGVVWFQETLNSWMLIGAALIVISGLYTFMRENRAQRVR